MSNTADILLAKRRERDLMRDHAAQHPKGSQRRYALDDQVRQMDLQVERIEAKLSSEKPRQ